MLRFIVIGCGSIGQRHISNLIALDAGRVIAFDTQSEQRHMVEENFKIKTVSTLEDGWKECPTVALIAAPSNLHVPLAMEATKHDCHLFVEKPLSHTLDGVEELLTVVEARHLTTMVGCNMRFHPGPIIVKKLLGEKIIGEVIAARIQTGSYLPRWRPWQDYRQSYSASPEWGGAILDCIHEIDLALWYLGPAKVAAAVHLPAKTIGLETDGLAEIILHHESGVLTNVHLNFVQRDYRRTCQIIGSEGTIYWDFADHCVRVYGLHGELAKTYPEPQGWEINQIYVDELAHFCSAVRSKSQTANPVAGGLEVLKVALVAKRMGTERQE